MSTRTIWLALFMLPALLIAQQDNRGTITGRITDSSGAVIPNATVRATNLATNVTISTKSNAEGVYEIPYLPSGNYEVEAELTGFKTWSRPNVELRMGDRLQVDIALELGDVAETVEVTAELPVLESASSTISQVISGEQITDLTLRSGSLAYVYAMAPGVTFRRLPYDGPWNIGDSSVVSVAGGGQGSFDFNVDGVANNSYNGQTSFVPPVDIVSEVKVQTTTYDAGVGHTRGGSINVSLKSGTNEFHGTAAFSVSSGPMMTRNFFTNKQLWDPNTGPITDEKIKFYSPGRRWLRYSATVGGPVVIPGIYNGKNKTFWMFGYQAHSRRRANNTTHSVPTEAQRTGDFSDLLALGSQYQIYDPFSTRPSGKLFRRDPIPNNIIPSSQIDPAGLKIINYYPLPNTAGTKDFLNNYSRTRQDMQDLSQPIVRVDHNFSENWRMFGRYSHSDFKGHFDKLIPDSPVRGRYRKRPHRGVALDNVFVLSPQIVFDVRYGFTWFKEDQYYDNKGWDLSEFFTQELISQLNPAGIAFPDIRPTGLLSLGNNGGWFRTNYTHNIMSVMNWMKGNHSVKFGADLRWAYESYFNYGNVAPRLNFGQTYVRGPFNNSPVAPAGQGTASLLFGIPTGGWSDVNDSRAELSPFYGFYVQDDWRITNRLTLNLGLRWEYEGPIRERFNRTTRQFDFETVNPIQSEAQANYAKNPIPEIPVSEFRTIGGVTFAGRGGNPRPVRDPYYKAWMPRAGFAYKLGNKTVIRGGWGMFFGLRGAEFSNSLQPGFNQRTSVVASYDNGQTYVASIRNPLPNGLVQPPGASGGLLTYLGRSPGFFDSDGKRPLTQRFSLSLQFQPFARSVFEVGYMGTRSSNLAVTTYFNPIPREYLSTSPTRDQETIDFFSAKVKNPFRGIDGFQGAGLYSNTNTNRTQLLRPYPHFSALNTSTPIGEASYNALLLRFERRLTAGFHAQVNYTWSKTIESTQFLNETDPVPERVVSNLDRPHRLVVNVTYQLPFGRGHRIGSNANALVNHLISGWQISAIYNAQSGPPLAWGNVIFTGDFTDIRLSGSERTLDRWFNTDGFNRNPKEQLARNIRTFPRRISAVRGDGINMWDLGLIKNIRIWEDLRLQIRGEAEGAMNHPNFNTPNVSPTSSLFGKVTRTQTGQEARRIFVGLKLIF